MVDWIHCSRFAWSWRWTGINHVHRHQMMFVMELEKCIDRMLSAEVGDKWDTSMNDSKFDVCIQFSDDIVSYFGFRNVDMWFTTDRACILKVGSSLYRCDSVDMVFYNVMLFKFNEWNATASADQLRFSHESRNIYLSIGFNVDLNSIKLFKVWYAPIGGANETGTTIPLQMIFNRRQ
jgi:hypothetical protein